MRRGDVYDAQLEPTEGSEQGGMRPVIILSRDAINQNSSVVIVVSCTTYRGRRIYPSQTIIYAPDGGMTADSVALGDQIRAISKLRLRHYRGSLTPKSLAEVEGAVCVALDLPCRF